MANTFAEIMEQDRQRITAELAAIEQRKREVTADLDAQSAELRRELAAISAYEAAKNGNTKAIGARRARRGSRREEIAQAIRDAGPISRGELIQRLGVKGDKSGEMSVSNALTALTKANTLARQDGKYVFQNAA